jgi:hypothetical protein
MFRLEIDVSFMSPPKNIPVAKIIQPLPSYVTSIKYSAVGYRQHNKIS